MLILSRRATESLNFPQLGISVTIVSVKGNRVQVGVEAPPEIRVLRRELKPLSAELVDGERQIGRFPNAPSKTEKSRHDFRNRLNQATLGLHLAQKQLAAGLLEAADETLKIALARLAELETLAQPPAARQVVTEAKVESKVLLEHVARQPAEQSSSQIVDVLLVEDDQNEQALLRGLLEMEGYRVHTASNGLEALACLQRVTPQFVLLDMMMPQCDGRETVERIRQVPAFQHLPIIAVSGSSPDSLGLPIGSEGVDDWFPKPLNAPRLVRHIRERVAGLCV